jgi:hypothetical protein
MRNAVDLGSKLVPMTLSISAMWSLCWKVQMKSKGCDIFKTESSSIPDLSWTRDAVENLLRAIEPSVKKKAEADGIVPGRAVKFDMTFSKPKRKG